MLTNAQYHDRLHVSALRCDRISKGDAIRFHSFCNMMMGGWWDKHEVYVRSFAMQHCSIELPSLTYLCVIGLLTGHWATMRAEYDFVKVCHVPVLLTAGKYIWAVLFLEVGHVLSQP
jgi:hypothetical protein